MRRSARRRGPPEQEALWREVLHEHLWRLLLDCRLPSACRRRARRLPPGGHAGRMPTVSAQTRDLIEQTLHPLGRACAERLAAATGEMAAGTPAPATRLDAEAWLAYWRGEVADAPPVSAPPSVFWRPIVPVWPRSRLP
jgi:hypothetical protein